MPPKASTISFTIAIFNRIASSPPRHRVLFEKSHQNSHRLNYFSTEGSPPIMPLHVHEEYKLVTDIECQERVHSVQEIDNFYRYMCSINNRNPPPPHPPNAPTPVLSLAPISPVFQIVKPNFFQKTGYFLKTTIKVCIFYTMHENTPFCY